MRIEPQYLECTAFLVAPGEDGKAIPQGTAFLVEVPDENEPGSAFEYVATARHCITDQHSPKIAVRINTMGPPTFDVPESYPGYQDVPTRKGDWWLHTDADVAAIELPPPNERGTLPLEYWSIPLAAFVDREYRLRAHKSVLYGEEIAEVSRRLDGYPVAVGDELFFTGLFVKSAGKTRNLPIARFGNISRMPGDELIPIETERGRFVHIRAYLAECRSWGGHSGSPVFWRPFFNPPVEVLNAQGKPETVVKQIGHFNALLGLVSGHFPFEGRVVDFGRPAKARRTRTDDLWARLNAGIAGVTPAEAIRELLMRPDVVEDRRKRSAERASESLRRNAAIADKGTAPDAGMQTTPTGFALPIPERGGLLADLKKATRKRKLSRRGRR